MDTKRRARSMSSNENGTVPNGMASPLFWTWVWCKKFDKGYKRNGGGAWKRNGGGYGFVLSAIEGIEVRVVRHALPSNPDAK